MTKPDTDAEGRGGSSRCRPDRKNKVQRRLALLKRTGLFGSNLLGAEISRASSMQELDEAYRLVYEIFLEIGYIKPNPYRIRIRTYEATAETATFIAKHDGKIVGVQSVVLDSPDLGLPSDVAFQSELDVLRSQGIRLTEATNESC